MLVKGTARRAVGIEVGAARDAVETGVAQRSDTAKLQRGFRRAKQDAGVKAALGRNEFQGCATAGNVSGRQNRSQRAQVSVSGAE